MAHKRVCILPAFHPGATGGVAAHVQALTRHLPACGWEVLSQYDAHALTHVHAAAVAPTVDVYTNHGIYPLREGMPAWQREQNRRIFDNLKLARQVVAVSNWTAAQWQQLVQRQPVILPNGVDLDAWTQVPTGTWRARLGLAAARPLVVWGKTGFSEVLDPRPAIELALRCPELAVVMPAPQSALPTAPANVFCVGPQPFTAMQMLLADADIYLATVQENHSVQLLEAMALAKPILGYAWGGTAETVAAAGGDPPGILVPPGDVAALAAALPACLDQRGEFGAAGRELVAARYQWRQIVEQLAEVYDAALAERRAEASGPVVSIVIPVYNKAAYIAETLQSALRQVGAPRYEIIVVDDGSTDDSLAQVQAVVGEDPGVTVISQPNAGVAAARNLGISRARGKYICCLDADDRLAPQFLQRTVAALDADPGLGVAYTDMHVFGTGAKGEPLNHDVRCDEYDWETLQKRNFLPCGNLFRKAAWQAAGGYKSVIDKYGSSWEDYELWLAMGAVGWFGRRVPGPLFHYRKIGRAGRDFESQSRQAFLRGIVNRLHPDLYPPLVTFVIPCYKHSRFLAEAIASCLAQTFPDFEVVVVDDGNAKAEAAKIATIVAEADGRADVVQEVRLVRLEKNSGLATARNAGIQEARGTWIVPLDADDVLAPTYLEEVLTASRLDPRRFVYTDSWLWWPAQNDKRQLLEAHEYDFVAALRHITWPCTIFYHKDAWRQVGGYKPEMSTAGGWEDWEFAINLGEHGICGQRVPQPLFSYRQHSKSQMRWEAEGVKERLRETLRAFHAEAYRGELPMGCCGNKAQPPIPPPSNTTLSGPEDQRLLVRYVGASFGSMQWVGPSGLAYSFGGIQPLQLCLPQDAHFFAQRADFQIVAGA